MARYPNRMVRVDDVPPQDLIPHPDNWRLHSELQKSSVDLALTNIGQLQRIVVNEPTGRVIDGHLRLALATEHGEKTVPVQYVDLDEAEEAAALATFDPLGDMAYEDGKKLRLNIERANLDWLPESGVGQLLSRLAPPPQLPSRSADHELPDGVEKAEAEPVPGKLAALRRFGGKSRSLGHLLPLLDVPCRSFIDAFAGGGHVLLNRPPSSSDILNDLDGDLVHYFRVLRDRGPELQEALRLTPYARDEHELAKEAVDEDVERARRLFASLYMSIAAVRDNTYLISYDGKSPNAIPMANLVDRLALVTERLRKVHIENKDAIEVVNMPNEATTLIYLDPPYVSGGRTSGTAYDHEMTEADHAALLDAAIGSPAMVAISGYPSDLYEQKLEGWRVAGWSQSLASANTNGGDAPIREERVWMNYNAQGVRIV